MHPCCGNDLQRGTKIVAIFEIVWYTIALAILLMLFVITVVFGITLFSAYQEQLKEDGQELTEEERKAHGAAALGFGLVLLVMLIISAFFSIISLVFAVILLKGSNERHIGKCRAWMIFRIVMWVLALLSLITGFIPALLDVIVAPYFIWVVYSFIKEMKAGGGGTANGVGVVYSRPPGSAPEKV